MTLLTARTRYTSIFPATFPKACSKLFRVTPSPFMILTLRLSTASRRSNTYEGPPNTTNHGIMHNYSTTQKHVLEGRTTSSRKTGYHILDCLSPCPSLLKQHLSNKPPGTDRIASINNAWNDDAPLGSTKHLLQLSRGSLHPDPNPHHSKLPPPQ